MKFAKPTTEVVDFKALKEGDVANATFKSFHFRKDWVFGTFEADGQTVTAIIGNTATYTIASLLPLKGSPAEITFAKTNVADGVTYPCYYVAW